MTGEDTPADVPTLGHLLSRVHRRLILLAILLGGAGIMVSGLGVMRGYATRNLTLVASTLAYNVEPAILFGDPDALRQETASIADNDMVDEVEIVGKDGKPLLRWKRPPDDMIDGLERIVGHWFWPEAVASPVSHDGIAMGQVRIQGSAGGMARYLLSALLLAISCIGLTLVAMRMLARRLHEGVIVPLDTIAQVAHDVRANRAFDRRVPVSGLAEVDRFVRDFNDLLAELEGWHNGFVGENTALTQKAMVDALTGIGNRAAFEHALDEAIHAASATGDSFGLLYLDANEFKPINDRYGHEAGDIMLRAIASRLREAIAPRGAAFRLGGDEFAVLVPGCIRNGRSDLLIEQLHRLMAMPVPLPDGRMIDASASIGLAVYPHEARQADALMRFADAEMYRNKFQRRGDRNARKSADGSQVGDDDRAGHGDGVSDGGACADGIYRAAAGGTS